FFFFFSSRRRHTRSKRDWSSDVCSSDLPSAVSPSTVRFREDSGGNNGAFDERYWAKRHWGTQWGPGDRRAGADSISGAGGAGCGGRTGGDSSAPHAAHGAALPAGAGEVPGCTAAGPGSAPRGHRGVGEVLSGRRRRVG